MTRFQKVITDDIVEAAIDLIDGRGWTVRRAADVLGVVSVSLADRVRVERLRRNGLQRPAAFVRPPQKDTRDKTARFCGDPMPGRSALDQKRALSMTDVCNPQTWSTSVGLLRLSHIQAQAAALLAAKDD
jgi:hypothetical protein